MFGKKYFRKSDATILEGDYVKRPAKGACTEIHFKCS